VYCQRVEIAKIVDYVHLKIKVLNKKI
jgi:hypothetical protein